MNARRTSVLSMVLSLAALTACGAATAPAADAASDGAQHFDATTADSSATLDSAPADTTIRDSASSDDVASDAAADANTNRDAPSDTAPPLEPSCDARRVLCDRVQPVCGRGEAPSVVGSCWGPCIAATSCACTMDEECPRVPGYSEVCYRTRMRCGPLL